LSVREPFPSGTHMATEGRKICNYYDLNVTKLENKYFKITRFLTNNT